MSTHPYVDLARKSIQYFLIHRTRLPCPDPLSPDLQSRSGAFVSIKKRQQLRGCIGTLEPTQDNLALEIIDNAIRAALHDPRFSPVTKEELSGLSYSIDVIHPLEKIESPSGLEPKVYGLVVRCNGRQGVLLPDLEGVETVEDQIQICRTKGKIGDKEPVELYRFRVERFR